MMRTIKLLGLTILAAMALSHAANFEPAFTSRFLHVQKKPFAEDEVLVQFKPALSAQSVYSTLESYNLETFRITPRLNLYHAKIPPHSTVIDTVRALSRNPDILIVEPNYTLTISTTPNDILFKYQYALYNSGQDIGIPGSPGGQDRADIKATAAWETTKGRDAVIIAVLDTGVDLLHPDLKNKIASRGRDLANDDNDATDDNGHGTHVAGIAAAQTNNTEGISGVAWNCRVLPVKVIDADGIGYYSWLIDGIIWATDWAIANQKELIINISAGGEVASGNLEAAVEYAFNNGVIIAAAAGNDSDTVLYPAAYDEYCLAVAATDNTDKRPEWSNYGPEIDVAAPGVNIWSLVPTWYLHPDAIPYLPESGTSMATPHVAGMAALLKSYKPWLTAQQIIQIIQFTADDVNSSSFPGKDNHIGHGRINMEKALVPIKISSDKNPSP